MVHEIPERRLGEPRHLRIGTVGAGAAGLKLAYQMERHMKVVDHIIYEKNAEVGGTWYENRYPGRACDIPSQNYQFTWEPNPDWNNLYSPAPEILEYFMRLAKKYDQYRFIKLGHQVVGARWISSEGIWRIKVKVLETDTIIEDWCHFMIAASGILNNWKWPDIPGLHSFKGELMHSGAWETGTTWEDKTVAVLGCGSSGVQIVPTMQPTVKNLITFIRTPTRITAGFAQSKAGPNGTNFAFSRERKNEFKADPDAYLRYRKEIEHELNSRFKFIIKDSPEQEEAVRFATNEMRTKLGEDSPLIKHLLPTFAVGCRRLTLGNGYLEALTKENVRVVTDAISEIVPEGIKLTTGEWKERPKEYMSLAMDDFPNHFMFLGPNAPIGHSSVLPIQATKYIMQMLHNCQTESVKSVVAKGAAVEDFTRHIDEFMKRTAWSSHCRSWFKNGTIDSPIVAVHPGSRIHWFHMLENPRYEDFEWESLSPNRFAYLGNGFSMKEEEGLDTAFYFDGPESGFERFR
ncbi:hypothetical protein CEP54_014312 [Fusarium duplospermum]|uniref:Monooxygenase n=1 Tax=Fusarium duplospermum TaxID=1325734 RepID=A0A428NX96_9HYPO|nr:hypothetical protein CEP54_014312 [Fusarium duplospermum]